MSTQVDVNHQLQTTERTERLRDKESNHASAKLTSDNGIKDTNNSDPLAEEHDRLRDSGTDNNTSVHVLPQGTQGFHGVILGHINLTETVEILRRDVLELREDFDDIYRSLCRLDGLGITPNHRTRFKAWLNGYQGAPSAEWDAIRKDYDSLLWDSRSLATSVANQVEDFRTGLIPLLQNNILSAQEKKKELKRILDGMEATKNQKVAQEISRGCPNFTKKIHDFQNPYGPSSRAILKNALTKDRCSTDKPTHELNRNIEKLLKTAEEHTAQYAPFWEKIRAGSPIQDGNPVGHKFVDAAGALLGAFGRESLISVSLGLPEGKLATPVRDTWNEISEVKKNLNVELKGLEDDASTSLQYAIPGCIKIAGARTRNICEKISAIMKLGIMLHTDARNIYDSWKDVECSPNSASTNTPSYHGQPKKADNTSGWIRAVTGMQISHEHDNRAGHQPNQISHDNDLKAVESKQPFDTMLLERQKLLPVYEELGKALIAYANSVA